MPAVLRPRSRQLVSALTPLALLVLLAAEFAYFDFQTSRHNTWIYPRWNDQIQYLTECYTGYEYRLAHGFWQGLWQTLVNPSAQGTLHDFLAVSLFSAVGPSRSAALSLNMLALIAWQGALFVAVNRTTRSRPLAWAAALLPVCLSWPWNGWAGSTADFRLDHFGMCAMGVTLAFALLADGFRSRRWSAGFGLSVGWTLLTRFITGPYFVLIFLALLTWLLCTPERRRRTGNLLMAALIAMVVAGPIFWLNREWVWNYYWIGHFTGPESALRNPHMGLGRSLAFVWGNLFANHLGRFFFGIAGTGAAMLALGVRYQAPRGECPRSRDEWWQLGVIFLLAPAVVLTLHQQKSEIVVGALVPGALILVVAGWMELQRRQVVLWPSRLLAAVVTLAAGGFFVSRQLQPAYDAAFAADARRVNMLADYIFNHAQAIGLKNPAVAVDQVTDCLDGQVLRVISYERHHVWVPFVMTLPTGIAEERESLIMERLAQSDFVFLTEDAPAGGWPYDREMWTLLPRTQAWCDAHLRLVEHFTLFGRRMVLYQRTEIP